MTEEQLLIALAADNPRLRKLVAEYGEEGRAAIDRLLRDEPVEAVTLLAAMVEAMRSGPADT
ncbi:hypothetical protein [Sphingobium ummariense]|uniref:Uncharacterized protein n=1 Tax=Sphingobium ummariense RL-3 TaxID=1346791 RepID=T0K9S4_9SPHN|nr:hypothetical protein [Sphingobium ummariense]EQB30133.1 hypothetical protein M529_21415 [Sphingobium ummariense RL-3]